MDDLEPLSREVHEALVEGVELFNRGLFWETHEVLERVWLQDRPPRKRFLQGLIKVAAGYHHYRNGNPIGMHHLLTAGRDLLLPFAPSYMGLDLEALLEYVERQAEWARGKLAGEVILEEVTPPKLTWATRAPGEAAP